MTSTDKQGVPETTPPPITVAQLVSLLAAMPQDAPVVIPGYEGGRTSVEAVSQVAAVRDDDQPWYDGEWREPNAGEQSVTIVAIAGVRHGER